MEMKVGVAVSLRALALFYWRPQFEATTRNVSARGLELLSKRPLSADAAVKLWIQLPTGVRVMLRGTVVRTTPDASTGALLCHINLSKRPKQSIQIWEDAIFRNIRNFDG